MADEPIIRLDNVAFAHAGAGELFSGLSAEFQPASFTLVRGPSGSGKSTLLRLICRLDEPSAGRLRYRGRPYSEIEPAVLRRKVCYLQQTPVTSPGRVRDNLLLPFSFKANSGLERPDEDRLREGLDSLLLDEVPLNRAASDLSVGQRQRLCLLRSLLLDPEVLLLDEPTSALDPESRRVVEDTAEERCLAGAAVIMVSHQEYEPGRVEPRFLDVAGGGA
jgi:putative ABC transport system ATP-binding protein